MKAVEAAIALRDPPSGGGVSRPEPVPLATTTTDASPVSVAVGRQVGADCQRGDDTSACVRNATFDEEFPPKPTGSSARPRLNGDDDDDEDDIDSTDAASTPSTTLSAPLDATPATTGIPRPTFVDSSNPSRSNVCVSAEENKDDKDVDLGTVATKLQQNVGCGLQVGEGSAALTGAPKSVPEPSPATHYLQRPSPFPNRPHAIGFLPRDRPYIGHPSVAVAAGPGAAAPTPQDAPYKMRLTTTDLSELVVPPPMPAPPALDHGEAVSRWRKIIKKDAPSKSATVRTRKPSGKRTAAPATTNARVGGVSSSTSKSAAVASSAKAKTKAAPQSDDDSDDDGEAGDSDAPRPGGLLACFSDRAVRFSSLMGLLSTAGLVVTENPQAPWSHRWCKRIEPEEFSAMLPWQRVNHFPGTWGIGRKDNLHKRLMALRSRFGAEHFGFAPDGFLMPRDKHAFESDYDQQRRLLRDKRAQVAAQKKRLTALIKLEESATAKSSNLTNASSSLADESESTKTVVPAAPGAGSGRSLDELRTALATLPLVRKRPLYIQKQVASACGRGMRVLSRVPSHFKTCLVQRYIDDPLLINDHKFDLRIYVLVTSFSPLRVYVFREGLCRFASAPYPTGAEANVTNRMAHLTNYSVNKKAEDFITPTLGGKSKPAASSTSGGVDSGDAATTAASSPASPSALDISGSDLGGGGDDDLADDDEDQEGDDQKEDETENDGDENGNGDNDDDADDDSAGSKWTFTQLRDHFQRQRGLRPSTAAAAAASSAKQPVSTVESGAGNSSATRGASSSDPAAAPQPTVDLTHLPAAVDYGDMWRDIDDVIIKTLISVEADVNQHMRKLFPRGGAAGTNCCYELYGFDVLLRDLKTEETVEVPVAADGTIGSMVDMAEFHAAAGTTPQRPAKVSPPPPTSAPGPFATARSASQQGQRRGTGSGGQTAAMHGAFAGSLRGRDESPVATAGTVRRPSAPRRPSASGRASAPNSKSSSNTPSLSPPSQSPTNSSASGAVPGRRRSSISRAGIPGGGAGGASGRFQVQTPRSPRGASSGTGRRSASDSPATLVNRAAPTNAASVPCAPSSSTEAAPADRKATPTPSSSRWTHTALVRRRVVAPVLMEVNIMPSLTTTCSELDQHVKGNMLADALTLVGCYAPGTKMTRRRARTTGNSFLDGLSQEEYEQVCLSEEELRRMGNFRRLMPTVDAWNDYRVFAAEYRPVNALLAEWERRKSVGEGTFTLCSAFTGKAKKGGGGAAEDEEAAEQEEKRM